MTKAKNTEELEKKVKAFLKDNQGNEFSIPQLCEKLGIDDDYIMSSAIGVLKYKKIVTQTNFRKVYREDVGKIHLALYSISLPVQH